MSVFFKPTPLATHASSGDTARATPSKFATAGTPAFERVGDVGIVRFGDASTRNAIGLAIARALSAPVEDGSLVRALVAEGLGALVLLSDVPGVFVSGGDLRELARSSREEADELTTRMRAFCSALGTLPVPSFALLEGAAFGGGSEIALATDFRYGCGGAAALNLWQTKWAVPGGWNGMARLSELVPALSPRRAGLLFAAARSLDTVTLRAWGLLDAEHASRDAALEAICAFAASFLSCPRDLREGLLARGTNGTPGAAGAAGARPDALRAHDEDLFSRHWMGPEHRARLDAFTSRAREKT